MKKAMLFLCALVLGLSINAQQFTNSGFETWSGNSPQAWNTLGFMGFNLCEVSKTTEAHNGNFAIKIAPAMLPDMLISALGMTESFAVPGFLTNGTINMEYLMEMMGGGMQEGAFDDPTMLANLFTGGLQLQGQPSVIEGFYKFDQVEGSYDMFLITAFLLAEVEGQRTIIGGGAFEGGMPMKAAGEYQSFSLQLLNPTDIPATEMIVLAVVSAEEAATDFSTLYLDDLNVVYNSGIEEAMFDNKVAVYPNPTSGDFKLNGAEGCKVRVCDVLGREVLDRKSVV